MEVRSRICCDYLIATANCNYIGTQPAYTIPDTWSSYSTMTPCAQNPSNISISQWACVPGSPSPHQPEVEGDLSVAWSLPTIGIVGTGATGLYSTMILQDLGLKMISPRPTVPLVGGCSHLDPVATVMPCEDPQNFF